MAASEERQINDIIKERSELLDAIQKRKDRGWNATKKQLEAEVKLSREIQTALGDKNKAAKSYNRIIKDAEKTEQNISKTITSRLGDLLKGNVASALSLSGAVKQSLAQKQISTKSADFATTLKKARTQQQLSVNDYGKMLDLTSGIKDGTIEKGDIEEHIYGLSKKGQDVAFTMLNAAEDLADAKKEETEATEEQEKSEKRINQYRMAGLAVFGALASIASKFGASLDKIGETFGSLSVMGEPFKKDLLDASVQATKLGGGIEDVAAITNTLASNFGMSVDEAATLSSKVFDTSKAIGLSGDEAANLFGTLMQTANLSADQAESLAEGAFQLARQKGVAPSAVLKDIAGSAEEIALFTKDGGDNIADAAVQARQMGLSLSTSAKIAEGLLDFESSIASEMEASIMIGKQLNYQKARQLALEGDIAGATKEIVDQVGSEADFNALNVKQRQSLAKSIGVSVSEMAKLVSGSEKLTLSGAMASSSFGDLLGEEGISNISSLLGKFKSLGATLVNTLGPTFETLIGNFNTFLANKENMDNLIGGVKSLASFFTLVAKNIDVVIGAFLGLKAGMIAFSIAQTVMQAANLATAASSAIAGGAAAGAATGPAAPIMIPLLIAGALAAVTAAVATWGIPSFDNLNPMSGAVVKGGTSTKALAQIQGGEGVFNVDGLKQQIGGGSAEQTRQITQGQNFGKIESALERLVSINLAGNEQRGNQRIIGRRGELAIASEPQRGGLSLGIV